MPDASDGTRDAILDAAEMLFARQGFAATTIKQLGAAAGVTPALLYYYFGDKDGLYDAVLRRLLDLLATAASERLRAAASPAEAVRGIVDVPLRLFVQRPQLPRLMLRELLDHEAAHAVPLAGDFMARAFSGLCDAIREGQRQGLFRADVRPEYAAMSTISQVVYLFLARPLFVAQLGERSGLADDAGVRAFAEHAADFALHALAAPAGGATAGDDAASGGTVRAAARSAKPKTTGGKGSGGTPGPRRGTGR